MFYEPDSLLRLSWESAMIRLGGKVISCEDAGKFSSATKGEKLADTIRIVSGYANIIVLNHSDIKMLKDFGVPVIDAKSGKDIFFNMKILYTKLI